MRRSLAILVAAFVAASCGLPPMISDTGYVGTWRGGNDRVVSLVAIARAADGYRVRVDLRTDDASWVTACAWDGTCEHRVKGVPTYRYRVRSWVEPETHRLRVEFDGHGVADPGTTDHYVDEFVVQPGGMRLECSTILRNGTTYPDNARPKRTFAKVANGVAASSAELRAP